MSQQYQEEKQRIRQNRSVNMLWIQRAAILMVLDIVIIVCSYYSALLLRFDLVYSNIPETYLVGYIWSMPYWVIITIVVFYANMLYHSIWRFAGFVEMSKMIMAYGMLIVFYIAGGLFMHLHMPRSYYMMGFLLSFILHSGLRMFYRFFSTYVRGHQRNTSGKELDRVMIIGAGKAGQIILREMMTSSHLSTRVCCVIDDNPNKKGRLLEGIPIVGNRFDIPEQVKEHQINRIIYAIPTTNEKERKAILKICEKCGCQIQTVPGMYQLVNGEVSVSQLRNVELQDLLGRDQIKVNNEEVLRLIRGLKVLVTGGGGSIGSELCRQIAANDPGQLIIFDIYENNAYEIQQELRRKYPGLSLKVLIGSVRNTSRINSIMEEYRPDIVFHAAAHKHVPLMEDSPNEAIKNNVMGTYKTGLAAAKFGVKKFLLVSTDKAVNPTNIMGASKRLCEMIIQMMNRQYSGTDFVAVRFGNVLESSGSVIPLFKRQITEGGPVTVTDKNIIRYFMTIPEAVSLILQAVHYAKGGEIFVLDMGKPVRIDDIARTLIRLSGYQPDVDIKIVYTGLRPGEKLYEELLMDEEGMESTENDLIYIGHPIEMNDELFRMKLDYLDKVSKHDSDLIREVVADMVPTYHYNKKVV